MILMSYNCRGLASAHKKLALKSLFNSVHCDIILLQETMGERDMVMKFLTQILPGWYFLALDSSCKSRGLDLGFKYRSIKLLYSWGFDLALGDKVFSSDIGLQFSIINIYDPCQDRVSFWNSFFIYFIKKFMIILGGNFNVSLGLSEPWGPHAQEDPLVEYFLNKFRRGNFLDIDPIKRIWVYHYMYKYRR